MLDINYKYVGYINVKKARSLLFKVINRESGSRNRKRERFQVKRKRDEIEEIGGRGKEGES